MAPTNQEEQTMLKNIEGQTIPSVTFATRQNDEWKSVTTDEIFTGRTVVVFSLPGAFTPTCSSTHLPRYNELAGVLKQNGVDEIEAIGAFNIIDKTVDD